MAFETLPDRMVLALTIWGEARGEAVEGQIAVACVVRNRLAKHAGTISGICLAPEQFSCFNDDSPEIGAMQRVATAMMTKEPTPSIAQAIWIADGVISGAVIDNTRGATHYLTTDLLRAHPPSWAAKQPVLTVIGRHSFLNVA